MGIVFVFFEGSNFLSFRPPAAFGEALAEQGRPKSAQGPFCDTFGPLFGFIFGSFLDDFRLKIVSEIEVEKKWRKKKKYLVRGREN